jgi:ribosomal protein S18 acetylase RimI-like enzyme
MAAPEIRLSAPESPADWAAVRAIFLEYARGLGIDLSFQDFDAELAGLPGAYVPPGGVLLLATVDGALAGCGALRPLAAPGHGNAGEMKRLYVRPAFRGLGLGRRIADALMAHARAAGQAAILLDVFDHMASARDLYRTLGFTEIAPYYANPLPGVHYLKADLA